MSARASTGVLAALAALTALVAAACSSEPVSTPVRRPNVLLVVVDTLRADRLGAYGSERGLTPFIDALARESVVFDRAYAQSSWTNPSVASMLTSRYQSQHGILSFGSRLADDELTLPEILGDHGYARGGFNANFLLRAGLGFGQGFDAYRTYSRPLKRVGRKGALNKARAPRVNAAAMAWLRDVVRPGVPGPPVFLYLQYMEPHAPYDPSPSAVRRTFPGGRVPQTERANQAMILVDREPPADVVRDVRGLYDAEVIDLDRSLRGLFADLWALGFLDDAIVVLTADHGEEIMDHGLMGHHHTLYQEVIHVPLIVRLPGRGARGHVGEVVSLVDLAPTLLALLDIEAPAAFEGRSLRPLLDTAAADPVSARRRAATSDAPAAFSELLRAEGTLRLTWHERAVIEASDKLILGPDGERAYFDLDEDPAERHTRADAAEVAPRLAERVQRLEAYDRARGRPVEKPVLDPETIRRMRALGYVE